MARLGQSDTPLGPTLSTQSKALSQLNRLVVGAVVVATDVVAAVVEPPPEIWTLLSEQQMPSEAMQVEDGSTHVKVDEQAKDLREIRRLTSDSTVGARNCTMCKRAKQQEKDEHGWVLG